MAISDFTNPTPPLTHRFGVYFFATGVIPNPIDVRFQRVSGLSAEVETEGIKSGGQNAYVQQLPVRVTHGNLVLERGVVIGSPLHLEFTATFSFFKFAPGNVMVTLFNEKSIPLMGWMFNKAYPVKWSVADLNAEANAVVIETMELAYSRYQMIQL